MHYQSLFIIAPLLSGVSANSKSNSDSKSCKPLPVSNQVTCSGINYINRGLVAYGTVASDARDKVGDTLGGFGSATAPDVSSFSLKKDGSVSGTLYAVPDRGWNTQGTIDFQGRIQKFQLTFKPTFSSIENGTENLELTLQKTTLLGKGKVPTTGLEAASIIPASGGFPDLPAAERSNGQVAPALDLEGLVRLHDGSFWVSDEYGPYIYHFTEQGQLDAAIAPPASFIPYADGEKTFLSGNPPLGSDEDAADDPISGRVNNHGFEGLAISSDERYLTALLQDATVQDGGTHGTRSNVTRQVTYDVSNRHSPRLVSEFVVGLPGIDDPDEDKNPRSTGASELHYLSTDKFFVLARDSGHGRGSGNDNPSTYRHIDIISTKGATNLANQEEAGPGALTIAPDGYLLSDVKTTSYCSFIDINNNTDLARFGLQNGAPYDSELNEKWESISIVPVPEGAKGYGKHEYYVIAISDNDFITQNGYYNSGKTQYADDSGLDVDTQVLVWQAQLPDYTSQK